MIKGERKFDVNFSRFTRIVGNNLSANDLKQQ